MHSFNARYLAELEKENIVHPFRGRYASPCRMLIASLVFLCLPALRGIQAVGLLGVAVCTAISIERDYKRKRKIGETGIVFPTIVVQANQALFTKSKKSAYCLVLFSPDPERYADMEYLFGLAEKIWALKNTKQQDPDLKMVAEIVTFELAQHYRRRKLPASFTGGPDVYVSDLLVDPRFLEGGCITERVLPCLLEPSVTGEIGSIELIPWWIAADQDKPKR